MAAAQPSVEKTWAAFEAVHRGDAQALIDLPAGSIDFTAKDKGEQTILEIACWRRNTRVIQALLDKGAPTTETPERPGHRPVLSNSLSIRDADTVALFLSRGAKIDYKDSFGYTPWHIAFQPQDGRYQAEIARPLIDLLHKAMIDRGQRETRIGGSGSRVIDDALMAAAQAGDLEWCKRFIEEGADANAIEPHVQSPLSAAVAGGHEAVVELLLKHGADAAKGPRPGGLLQLACGRRNNARILKRLIDSSPALVETIRKDGDEPLRTAIILGDPAVLETLMAAGADPHDLETGPDALHLAIQANNPSTVEVLLKAGFRSGPLRLDPSRTHLDAARTHASQSTAIEQRRILELLEAAQPMK